MNLLQPLLNRPAKDQPELALSNQIHEVWYCISAGNKRVTRYGYRCDPDAKSKKAASGGGANPD
jgi:hypothetical protein